MALPAGSLLPPEKWARWEWGRRFHPGCWHGAPHLGCWGTSPASPSATDGVSNLPPAAIGLHTYSCIMNKYTIHFLFFFFLGNSGKQTAQKRIQQVTILLLGFTASVPKSSPPQVVNAAIVLPVDGVAPFLESLMDLRAAAKVMHDVTQFRNQPRLCNGTLPPRNNLGLCQAKEKTSLEAKGEKIKAKQQHVF